VTQQLALLKQHSDLPVLFTVRTVSQGGKFPDKKNVEALELMLLAVGAAGEYIDVELSWPVEMVKIVKERKGNTVIVASWQEPGRAIKLRGSVLKERYIQADKIGGR
jgi:pentafunctional AROM polypeptide